MVPRVILILVTSTVLDLVTGNTDCPLPPPCRCYNSTSDPTKRVIDCRSHTSSDLNVILNVTSPSNELFDELAIQNRDISYVGPNAFSGLRFRKLDLSGNKIASFDLHAFTGLENDLLTISLEANGNIPFPFPAMQNLTNLKDLKFKKFKQGEINENTKFEYFPNLEKLEMTSTGIDPMRLNSFRGKLAKLKYLTVVDNTALSNFPVPVIAQLRTLTHLKWSSNDMTTIGSQAFANLTNLIELDLSHNKISQTEVAWYEGIANNLELLDLQFNALDETTIQTLGVPNWPKLHQMNLALNKMSSIPNGLFSKMPDLSYLSLGANQLTTLQRSYFTGLGKMYSLDLHENEISTIENNAFADMPDLGFLALEDQRVTLNLNKDSINGSNRIERLRLGNTALAVPQIWDAIRELPNLVELDLSGTGVNQMQDLIFMNHNRMTLLNLDGNGIKNITQASLHGLAGSLQSLSLSNNNITEISSCVLRDFTRLEIIHLGGNPLHCDCKLIWLYDWIKGSSDPFISITVNAVCAAPQTVQNQNLANLNRSQLVCESGPVQETCQTFTTTTTSTTTTTTMKVTTSEVPKPTIKFAISSSGKNFIQVSWAVSGDRTHLVRFEVSYQKLGVSNAKPENFPVDRSETDYRIDGLEPDSNYQVCLETFIQNSASMLDCLSRKTDKAPVTSAPETKSDQNIAIIGGSVAGSVVAVVVIVIIIVMLLRFGQAPKKHPPPVNAVQFIRSPTEAPRVGYDSKRFSKPKKAMANGEVKINVISDGKTVDNSRISAGSYQNINPDAQMNGNPPSYRSVVEKMPEGASGGNNDLKVNQSKVPFSQNPHHTQPSPQSRYVKTPVNAAQGPKKPHYVNSDAANIDASSPDHYANSMDTRPLPKTPRKPLSDTSSGFLNHGFTHSPTDNASFGYTNTPENHYHTPSDSVYNELSYDSGTIV